MKIRDIMSTDILKATPDNTLSDIALMMKEQDTGVLPVVEDADLMGIVTDRDIVVRAIAEGKDPTTTTVDEVLSEDVEIVSPDDEVERAADIMSARQIRRLPVLEDHRVIGMVSLGDIAVKHEEGTAAHALEGISEGVRASTPLRRSSRSASSSDSETASTSPTKTRKTTRKRAA
jgi:CBS domain-containing protein